MPHHDHPGRFFLPASHPDRKARSMFWILHLAAVIFFLPALFITIPLHLIYAKKGKPNG